MGLKRGSVTSARVRTSPTSLTRVAHARAPEPAEHGLASALLEFEPRVLHSLAR